MPGQLAADVKAPLNAVPRCRTRSAALDEVREPEPHAIEQDACAEHGMRGQHRLSTGGALAVALPEPIARHKPHAFASGLAPHVEQLGAGTEAILAVLPDLSEVLGIGISQRVAPFHTRDIATLARSGQGPSADVNGINLYYETHGSGRPLILLHGGLGSGEMFGPVLPMLTDGHLVIAVDLQGHGRTADIDRPLSIELMADDIAALIKHLGLERPDVMGYSLGGGVPLFTAVRHPELVGRLGVVSAHIR